MYCGFGHCCRAGLVEGVELIFRYHRTHIEGGSVSARDGKLNVCNRIPVFTEKTTAIGSKIAMLPRMQLPSENYLCCPRERCRVLAETRNLHKFFHSLQRHTIFSFVLPADKQVQPSWHLQYYLATLKPRHRQPPTYFYRHRVIDVEKLASLHDRDLGHGNIIMVWIADEDPDFLVLELFFEAFDHPLQPHFGVGVRVANAQQLLGAAAEYLMALVLGDE